MPLPSSRIDLAIVPSPSGRSDADAAVGRLWAAWREAGVFDAGGAPGPRAGEVAGGFVRARVDRPGGPTLYGNRIGGFRARCPACGANGIPGVVAAMRAWRAGGAPVGRCGACGADWSLDEVTFAPEAAPGTVALVLADVGEAVLSAGARQLVEARVGAHRVVVQRVGR